MRPRLRLDQPRRKRRRLRRVRPRPLAAAAAVALALAVLGLGATLHAQRPLVAAMGAALGAVRDGLARAGALALPAAPVHPRAHPPTAEPPLAAPAAVPGAGAGAVSHAQLALLLTSAWGLAPTTVGPAFADVTATTPGAAAIEAAAGAGDFGPDPGPDFRPGAPVSRLFLAGALVNALGLGPAAARMNGLPVGARDAGRVPPADRGAVRLAIALGLVPTHAGAFDPTAIAPPALVSQAVAAARALAPARLSAGLAGLPERVSVSATPATVEPGQPVALSAAVHTGELALPVGVAWSVSAGTLAAGTLVATAPGRITVTARAAGGARASAAVTVLAPSRLAIVAPPQVAIADQPVSFTLAVQSAHGRTVTPDSGRPLEVTLEPPSGPSVRAAPVDRGGVAVFTYRPSVLGQYTLRVRAPGLVAAQATLRVVPGPLGALSLASSSQRATYGARLSVSAVALTTAAGSRAGTNAIVPVELTATLVSAAGPSVHLGTWHLTLSAAGPALPVPVTRVGPLDGPGSLVLNLTSPGGAYLPARLVLPVDGLGPLVVSPASTTITAGSAFQLSVRAPGAGRATVPLSLSQVAPDGAPLAAIPQVLAAGRAQFLLAPRAAGVYHLTVTGRGLATAHATVRVLPGRPASLVAALATPDPLVGQPVRLRALAVDRDGNPLVGTPLNVAWRPSGGTKKSRWHRLVAASGAWLTVPVAAGAADCSVTVSLAAPSAGLGPVTQTLPCRPIHQAGQAAAGTGLFLSYWVARDAPAAALVDRAVSEHLHTLFVEVAIPGTGFWGEPGLDRLLTLAHDAGLSVVAWVPANLYRPAQDLATAKAALAYRTPDGLGVDGVAADFEGNLAPSAVTRYLAAVRAAAGPGRVVCAVLRAPTDLTIPYGLVGRYAEVLMPMDYWENTQNAVGYGAAYRLVQSSVELARSQAPGAAVVPILQAYDAFAGGGTGVYNPPPLAEWGAVTAARQSGALGAAFFQWGTLTPGEWRVVAATGRIPF